MTMTETPFKSVFQSLIVLSQLAGMNQASQQASRAQREKCHRSLRASQSMPVPAAKETLRTDVIFTAILVFPLDRCPRACCFSLAGSLRLHILSSPIHKNLEFRQLSVIKN